MARGTMTCGPLKDDYMLLTYSSRTPEISFCKVRPCKPIFSMEIPMPTPPNRSSRLMSVVSKTWVTPNMIRVTFGADWMTTLEAGIEGAHFKLFLRDANQSIEAFEEQLEVGPRPTVRTYTIRSIRVDAGEIDVDFVDHGDTGPASAWARSCDNGDVVGFAGPGPIKLKTFFADYYVLAADMSAIPVVAATLEAMPRDAKGKAYIEITTGADQQDIDAPRGIDIEWIVQPTPHDVSSPSVDKIQSLPPFSGTVQTCIAGESSMIKALRQELVNRRELPKQDMYISGYWKIGLGEDAHQKLKNKGA